MKNSNLSMTYLGKVNVAKENKITAEEKFPISEQRYCYVWQCYMYMYLKGCLGVRFAYVDM